MATPYMVFRRVGIGKMASPFKVDRNNLPDRSEGSFTPYS